MWDRDAIDRSDAFLARFVAELSAQRDVYVGTAVAFTECIVVIIALASASMKIGAVDVGFGADPGLDEDPFKLIEVAG